MPCPISARSAPDSVRRLSYHAHTAAYYTASYRCDSPGPPKIEPGRQLHLWPPRTVGDLAGAETSAAHMPQWHSVGLEAVTVALLSLWCLRRTVTDIAPPLMASSARQAATASNAGCVALPSDSAISAWYNPWHVPVVYPATVRLVRPESQS